MVYPVKGMLMFSACETYKPHILYTNVHMILELTKTSEQKYRFSKSRNLDGNQESDWGHLWRPGRAQADGPGLNPEEFQFCGEEMKDELEKEIEQAYRKTNSTECGYSILKNIWNKYRLSGLISLVKTMIKTRCNWN